MILSFWARNATFVQVKCKWKKGEDEKLAKEGKDAGRTLFVGKKNFLNFPRGFLTLKAFKLGLVK